MQGIFAQIHQHVKTLKIIDPHEHLPGSEEKRNRNTDILREYLIHYFNRDLISAGLKDKEFQFVIDTTVPIEKRWKAVEPYWEVARYTGYGRALDITVRDLYGFEKIKGDNIEELNEAFKESLKGEQYKKVLKEKSNIAISLLDSDLDCDREYFRSVYRLDYFVVPSSKHDILYAEEMSDMKIDSMDRWMEACERVLDKVFQSGVVALKCGLAYQRSLYFERATKSEAEEEFNAFFRIDRDRILEKQ